ncbi:hypothetical protein AB0H15_22145, partial [Streptomyces milbemycinicus]
KTGQLCDGQAPVTAPDKPGEVDHTIDAGVYIQKETPTPTPTPTPPSSEPPSSEPPTHEPPASVPPNKPGPQTGGGGGSLANTGTSGLLTIISLSALLAGTGAAFAYLTRKRRTRLH